MIIKIVRQGGKTEVINDAMLMLVEDHKGDPVSVAARYGIGQSFMVSCIDDEVKFNHVLRNLGIDKVVVKAPVDQLLRNPDSLPIISR